MDTDKLLALAIGQAGALGIPISTNIHPHVALNTRAVGRFGCCSRRGNTDYIELSARLPAAGERAVLETLAHEILHTCRGCRNHGARWQGYAAKMNAAYGYHISRTGSWEAMGLPNPRPVRYLLACTRCGVEIGRVRASSLVQHPERYRCRCGGALERKEMRDAP